MIYISYLDCWIDQESNFFMSRCMFGTILTVCLALNVESINFEAADKAPTKIGSASGKVDTCANGTCKSVVRSKSVVRNRTASCGSCSSTSKKRVSSSCRGGRFLKR